MDDVDIGGGSNGGMAVAADDVQFRAKRIGSLSDGLRTELSSVSEDVDRLLGSWRGGAATAYSAGWSEVRAAAGHLLDALSDTSLRVESAVDGYRADDARNAETLQRMAFGAAAAPGSRA